MDTKDLEKRVNKMGGITYWKENVLVGKKCTVCGEDKPISEFHFRNKKKGTYNSSCKECEKQRQHHWYENNIEHIEQYREANKEHIKEQRKQYREINKEHYSEYEKQRYKANKERYKEYNKQYYQNNKDRLKEYDKQHYEANKEHKKVVKKQHYEANKEYYKDKMKQWYKENKGHIKEYSKQRYETDKSNNVAELTKMLHQLTPMLKKLNVKAYGSIYKITNIKTGKCYIGQTVQLLKHRYREEVIKGWIEERKRKKKQKFSEELIEENFVIETIDYGICQYHLDKLEAYYIDKFDSYNNGYNNNVGHYKTDDGIEEFIQILEENNLEFIDNKIIKKRLPKQA